jgi:hypothetical protein
VDEDSRLLVNILEQLRDIRLCLDGKDGVIVYWSTVFWTLSARKFRRLVSRVQPVALDGLARAFCSHVAQ